MALTELEYVTLGLVSTEQPCTAYAIRMRFARSPSAHWSGSAGAIYPLMRRLEKRGYLRSGQRAGDQRRTRVFGLTPRGERELRAWLSPPLPSAAELLSIDPLRIRVRFLSVLTPTARRTFINEAIEKLSDYVRGMEAEANAHRTHGENYVYFVGRGAVLSVRAQIAWLKELRTQM